MLAIGAMLGGIYHLLKRRVAVAGASHAESAATHSHHPTFAPLQEKLWTPFNQLLAVLMSSAFSR